MVSTFLIWQEDICHFNGMYMNNRTLKLIFLTLKAALAWEALEDISAEQVWYTRLNKSAFASGSWNRGGWCWSVPWLASWVAWFASRIRSPGGLSGHKLQCGGRGGLFLLWTESQWGTHMGQPGCKARVGKRPLPSSLTWSLAGFSSSEAISLQVSLADCSQNDPEMFQLTLNIWD